MANISHNDSQGSEEEEGEIKEPEKLESEEEDLVLKFGDESNDSIELKKRKRSIEEHSSNNAEKDLLKLVEADLNKKMENKRIKCEPPDEVENNIDPHVRIKIEPTEVDDQVESEVAKEMPIINKVIESDKKLHNKEKIMKKNVFTNEALMKVQDVFGVNFDNEIFGKYGKEDYEEEENDFLIGDSKSGEKSKSTKKQVKKKSKKKFDYDIYEPSHLRRVYSINLDKEICATDIPERMQLRLIPVTSVKVGSNELDLESKWIYEEAFCKPTVSIQNSISDLEEERLKFKIHNRHQTIRKIRNVLDFIRNQHFEIPFIASYRKEFIYPELDISDLWKVYKYDGKWCQLQQRKKHLLKLFVNMQSYQLEGVNKNADTSLPVSIKLIKNEDIERLKNIDVSEEIHDFYRYFKLHYSHEIPAMKRFIRRKEYEAHKERLKKKQIAEGAKENETELENIDNVDLDGSFEVERNDPYFICKKAGLDSFIKKFGISSEQFAENLRDSYQRHEVKQEIYDPMITARKFCGLKFSAPEKILKSAQFMFAIQLACEPLVRKTLRNLFMQKAKFSVRATKKGMKEIDENHPLYRMKYLKNKPVKDLIGDQFLKLVIAEQDDLITLTFSDTFEGVAANNYIDEIKQFLSKQDDTIVAQAWNSLRAGSMEMALTNMVIIDLKKELRANLLFEAKDCVMRECGQKLYNWIKVAPYNFDYFGDDDEEWNTSKGIRVMGLSFSSDESQSAYTCIVAPNGECTDFLKLPHLLKRKNSVKEHEKLMKEADLSLIRNFIIAKKPHVVAIGGESREALIIQFEIQEIVASLAKEEQFPTIKVEICDNDLTKVYVNSDRVITEFRDYSSQLRQAISIGRRLQDPLIEFSQLCNTDDDILKLKYHSLQDQLPQDELLENIYTEFINQVNQVGVDVNFVAQKYYAENLLQFVCGLGPRKAQDLIKMIRKQSDKKLENRAQLVTICNLGPKVFVNCAGFIKINSRNMNVNKGAYVEVLDNSRIHPENYEWARYLAVNALESEDDETMNPVRALEEILQTPEKLKILDLDAFTEQLQAQGYGDKKITLYDICAELSCMFKDFREPYKSLTPEQLFYILTKETVETLFVGKLIMAKVLGISYKKPQGEQIENMRPVRNDETGFWQCLFCFKNDFLELPEVWTHFETTCPGRATGVKIRLDNGISGFIHIKNLSDKIVTNPRERVCINQPIHCRIIRIDVEKYGVECTSRSKDLADKDNEWRAPKDPYYDKEGEDREKKMEEEVRKSKIRQSYMKRIIGHPCFKNIDFADAERLMRDKRPGEIIIRPSSKGPNHLTVTWKMADEVIQHIDVIEEGKASDFVLGAKLRIGNDEFEDLDDIFIRLMNPMIGFVNEILNFKYYKPRVGGNKDRADEVLKIQKRDNPNAIPYIISASRQYPGNFLLSYLPRNQCRHEYFSVVPDGLKFRTELFVRLNDLLRWFKENFKEPVPNQPSTPREPPQPSRPPYQPPTPAIRTDEFQKEAQVTHRQYPSQTMYHPGYPPNPDYQPNHSDYPPNHSNYPDYPPKHPEYPPKHPDYPSKHSEYPSKHPDYPQHPDYPPKHSEYPPKHSEYPPKHSEYPPKHSEYPPKYPDYPPKHSDYPPKYPGYSHNHPDYPPKHPEYSKHPDYPPKHPDYSPKHPEYPPKHPDYSPKHSDYPPKHDYPSKHSDYPPKHSDYPPKHPDYPQHSDYSPKQPDYPPKHSDYAPNHPDYPPKHYPSNRSDYPDKHYPDYYPPTPSNYQSGYPPYPSSYSPSPSYQSSSSAFQSNKVAHQSSLPFYQTNQPPLPVGQPPLPISQPPLPVGQPPLPVSQPPLPVSQPPLPPPPISQPHQSVSPTVTGVAEQNGKISDSQNSPSSTENTNVTAAPNPGTSQTNDNQNTADKIQPKPAENAAPKPTLSWAQQIKSKVFDDSYFTKAKRKVLPYDNGVGQGILKNIKERTLDKRKQMNEPFKAGFDNSFGGRGSRESSRSRDNFDDFSRGTPPHDNGDFNPFTIPRDSGHSSPGSRGFSRGHSQERGSKYSPSRRGDRSPSYHSRSRSRERSPRYNSRSSWDRSPTYGSNHSRDRSPSFVPKRRGRSPNFKYSRNSWDRSPDYGQSRSRSRSRSPVDPKSRGRYSGFKKTRWGSPPQSIRPQFGSEFLSNQTKKGKLPPPSAVPTPDEENPFLKGSSRDPSINDGNSSPTEVPKKIYPFNRGRGRGFKSYAASSRGRGAKYDIVSPCEFTPSNNFYG